MVVTGEIAETVAYVLKEIVKHLYYVVVEVVLVVEVATPIGTCQV